ncbi:Crp/Fnr family transcriptional regulator [Algoriphagus aquimarinus]|uniref:Crp/Fnr family transcriptional regulator n=1 Tax=Algoriphagus aquimarinus TaxID=237018 RepID=A0A5C7AW95_9BACT|nr:Crp/Fnr family transcriptional regulator [Algoriphagus aquimarinus]TXE12364.1 Crp/Fnr family transcriptional regulator [Algoriphagus aquimarinus]
MDYSLLLSEFRRVVEFPDKEFLKLTPLIERIRVKKNEHLLKAGDISRKVYFVEEGCLRQYLINTNGEERNIYFKVECGWCSELESFLNNTPTELSIQALEDSQLLAINEKNWIYAVTHIPPFTMYFIRAQQQTNYMLKKRLGEATIETPEEKYIRFLQEEPQLLLRLPLFQIAAYLGITPETISRVRKKIGSK